MQRLKDYPNALLFTCPYCEALPGENCQVVNGNRVINGMTITTGSTPVDRHEDVLVHEARALITTKVIEGNKWIEFRLSDTKPKTQVWVVVNRISHRTIAIIKWYAQWRQYIFIPEPHSYYDDGCLETIKAFIERLNKERQV